MKTYTMSEAVKELRKMLEADGYRFDRMQTFTGNNVTVTFPAGYPNINSYINVLKYWQEVDPSDASIKQKLEDAIKATS